MAGSHSIEVTAFRGAELVPARVEYRRGGETEDASVRVHGPWGVAEATAHDVFEALLRVRRELEAADWFLAVHGARRDVVCLGQVRNWSSGTEVHHPEATAVGASLFLFGPADPALVGTVAEQEALSEEHTPAVGEPPEVTEEMRAVARHQPNSWLYSVDAEFDTNGVVPPWGVRGGYRVDEDGNFGEWAPNPGYRPGPQALGWPRPTNQLERDLELALSGYGPRETALRTLLGWELVMVEYPDHPGELFLAEEAGGLVLDVCTSAERLPESWTRCQQARGDQLLDLGGVRLRLNAGVAGALSATIPLQDLIDFAAGAGDGVRGVPAQGES
ncbi:type VII secretion system-associated protein [Crossiella sp. SN42]|uniref:type VII secretion system-associated protein n=1 Tax=Crossiella sp. SN42 TaxID=2944808 RepID=UPI00207D0703|nr:type VII secretion system-associated protein [Crossiella sp. SN42]MCO1576410.1 type VII secretion system-associated protein [Crossiella sp. SN42]